MVTVAIQPSYGNSEAKHNWALTLDEEVDFTEPERALALKHDQRRLLDECHPDGRARFWGATKAQDDNFQKLAAGDIIVFTGGSQVRAVGRIGVILSNAQFGDTLWNPHPKNGSWRNIYSLAGFEVIGESIDRIRELPGFNPRDNFMSMRVLQEDLGYQLLHGLHIEAGSVEEDFSRSIDLERRLVERFSDGGAYITEPEAVHIAETSYHRPGGDITVHRGEALMVQHYRKFLDEQYTVNTIRSRAFATDLYIVGPDDTEIIEAKSGWTRVYVRQALAQLLDYAAHAPSPPDRISGLFPARPDDDLVNLLHRYGADCIHLTGSGDFVRLEAPADRKAAISAFWHDGGV